MIQSRPEYVNGGEGSTLSSGRSHFLACSFPSVFDARHTFVDE
jgi:hypothetical protein